MLPTKSDYSSTSALESAVIFLLYAIGTGGVLITLGYVIQHVSELYLTHKETLADIERSTMTLLHSQELARIAAVKALDASAVASEVSEEVRGVATTTAPLGTSGGVFRNLLKRGAAFIAKYQSK